MSVKDHWEKVYTTKAPDRVSWYLPHLETSLSLIERAASGHSASIIDVGGGESTLVDDLLARGHDHITILDISEIAIDVTKKRLGLAAQQIHWLVADITEAHLESGAYDVWHDRAVFHFLTASENRAAYVRQVVHAGTVLALPQPRKEAKTCRNNRNQKDSGQMERGWPSAFLLCSRAAGRPVVRQNSGRL